MTSKAAIRREPLKKPRPLKSVNSSDTLKFHIHDPKDAVVQKSKEEILADLEILNVSISNCNFDDVTAADISRMCAILKKRGEELDKFNKDAIDRYFCTLRNASREERLDMVSRLKLLETIEIRANGWKKNDNIQNYFNSKILDLEQGIQDLTLSTSSSMTSVPFALHNQTSSPANTLPLAPGEILRSSGKFAKPTKISGKNVFKDEILIRNSDSGKVMGIKGRRVHMIEELSDTVISFQRVNPGARDRLVQITGPHEEAIGHAKLLVEDTIRRNASPIRENSDMSVLDNTKDSIEYNNSYSSVDNQMFMKRNLQHSYSLSDASLREHSVSVQIDQDLIRLTGTNAELLKTAKLVLMEYFAGQTEINEKHESYSSLNRQSSPDRNRLRLGLQKQSSLKSNIDNMYSTGWTSYPPKRDSVSPFSSSDDDFVKDDKRIDMDNQYTQDTSVFTEAKRRTVSLESSNVHGQLMRRSSVPNDFGKGYGEMYSPINDQVFSPVDTEMMPIPPPTYKKMRYSRESLLNLANSPLSHNQPMDYAHIHQHFQEIICQSPVMFDPQKFKERTNKSEDATTMPK
ncbi:eukaryotic translation initiation factor 4E-binding protein Mextli isoform X2 [Parasteatoda tepidariorum]|uniref:eukaryotic translation initiation factor 4E-binding protein Mextli isoform X2 n=1 Tax=Parasteatoda tepidariorum TaxID=114398 RepID=UPI001C719653|nr:eukaryotic translation initiation factor 4E-binding protein Mextli isoform X2 [Parasteatoda tepidariorum]